MIFPLSYAFSGEDMALLASFSLTVLFCGHVLDSSQNYDVSVTSLNDFSAYGTSLASLG